MKEAFLGLGSNLNNPAKQIQLAISSINLLPYINLKKSSSFYYSSPLYGLQQPDYVNAVVNIKTDLCIKKLLNKMQLIEQKQGRPLNHVKNTSRIIDIDIILFGDERIDEVKLKIPHPGIYTRNFWIYPLYEIAPNLILPNSLTIAELKQKILPYGLKKLKENEVNAADYINYVE